jgi:phage terminase small subunit
VKQDKDLAPGQPEKPKHLSERASAEWDRLASELVASNIRLTPAHRSTLTHAATLAADIAEAYERVKVDGCYIVTKAGLVQHPASKRLDALRRDQIKVLTMLGLRTAVPTASTDKGPTLEDQLNGEE